MTHLELAKLCYDITAAEGEHSWDVSQPSVKENSLNLVKRFLEAPNTDASNRKARIYSSVSNDLISVDSNDSLAVAKAVLKAVGKPEKKEDDKKEKAADKKKDEATDKEIEKEFKEDMKAEGKKDKKPKSK